MKKLVFASAMALASVSLVSTPALRAQDNSGQITISDATEFNAYQTASTQTDPAAKAAALESFLKTYPQSVVKKAVLDELMSTYQGLNQPDQAVSAATRLLQIDPNNMKAIFISVFIQKSQCSKNVDPKTGNLSDPSPCDNAAALAQKGLTAPKPAGMSDDDWKKITSAAYPAFHSAIALDDALSKKDFKGAIQEYRTELMLYPPDATTKPGPGLADTLQLAQAYAKPDARDEVQAVWFYARAWNFAPPSFKPDIETQLEYWYKRYHGGTDGLDAVKTAAASTLFPPSGFKIDPAPTPPEVAHKTLMENDPAKLNLEDKEYILANGTKEDTDKLWAVIKGQVTPVPGVVVDDPASVLKVSVTTAASVKPKEYVVKLNTPSACSAVPPAPTSSTAAAASTYLQANGASADVSAIADLDKAHKVTIEPAVAAINVAVTEDAKDAKPPVADFVVNLKEPVSCKEAPAAGTELKLQPNEELDGTYDTFAPIAAAGDKQASAQIVLSDGFLQQEKKEKAAPVHHKPAAAHRPGM
jgi:hypothetical protein